MTIKGASTLVTKFPSGWGLVLIHLNKSSSLCFKEFYYRHSQMLAEWKMHNLRMFLQSIFCRELGKKEHKTESIFVS